MFRGEFLAKERTAHYPTYNLLFLTFNLKICHPERSTAESKDLLFGVTSGLPTIQPKPRVGVSLGDGPATLGAFFRFEV